MHCLLIASTWSNDWWSLPQDIARNSSLNLSLMTELTQVWTHTVQFLFYLTREHFLKKSSGYMQTSGWHFYGFGFFNVQKPLRLWWCRPLLMVDKHTLVICQQLPVHLLLLWGSAEPFGPESSFVLLLSWDLCIWIHLYRCLCYIQLFGTLS